MSNTIRFNPPASPYQDWTTVLLYPGQIEVGWISDDQPDRGFCFTPHEDANWSGRFTADHLEEIAAKLRELNKVP